MRKLRTYKGFQDYLRHQDFLAEARLIREGAGDMLEQTEILKLHQAPNHLSVLQIFKTLRDDTLKEDHINRIRSMNALARLTREALVLCKYADHRAAQASQTPATLDPTRNLTPERDLILSAMERGFGVNMRVRKGRVSCRGRSLPQRWRVPCGC